MFKIYSLEDKEYLTDEVFPTLEAVRSFLVTCFWHDRDGQDIEALTIPEWCENAHLRIDNVTN